MDKPRNIVCDPCGHMVKTSLPFLHSPSIRSCVQTAQHTKALKHVLHVANTLQKQLKFTNKKHTFFTINKFLFRFKKSHKNIYIFYLQKVINSKCTIRITTNNFMFIYFQHFQCISHLFYF